MKTENNYIYEYYQGIKDGTIVVGQWIRLAYEMIIKGLEKKSFFYSAKKATAAIFYIENFCHHHEGALAPGLIKLELWQKAAIAAIFGIVDEDGYRHFREAVIIIARKNGKSLMAAAIASYMSFMDGEYGARIYFTAPKLQQAEICFNAYYQMIMAEPELLGMVKKRRTDVYINESNSSAAPLAFTAKRSDGLNISLGVCDEIASWPGQQGIKFYDVLRSSFGARKQPLLLSISTSGYENEGAFDELVKRSTGVLRGTSEESRLLPLLYMIDDTKKWNDINELQKSNPNLGVSVSVDYMLEEIAIAEGSFNKKSEFMTKYCNIKQSSAAAWLSRETVIGMSGDPIDLEQFRECYCVAGLDLSQTTDLTAACIVIEKEGKLYVVAKCWLPSGKIDEAMQKDGLPYYYYIRRGWLELSGDNFVDYADVYKWFTDLIEKYEIYPLKVGYDRYSAQYLIQDMKNYGFHCDDVYQGENLWPVLQEMEGIFKDGKVCIGDNDLLKVHLLNSAIKMSQERGRGKLIKIAPTAHIDAVAALTDAFTVRQKWHDQIGSQLRNMEYDDEEEE